MARLVFLLAACSLLTACGGGNSSPLKVGPTINQSTAGIWTGTTTSNSNPIPAPVVGLVTDSNDAFFHTERGNFHGKLTSTGDRVTGTLLIINSSGTANVTVAGSIHQKQSLSIAYTTGSDKSTFDLTYSPEYEQPSSLQSVSGNWDSGLGIGGFRISPDGTIDTFLTNCAIGGFTMLDSSLDVYKVNVSIGNCVFNVNQGTYQGFAILTETDQPRDTLTVFLDDGKGHMATIKSNRI
jgi:hypothetical protein